MDKNLYIKPESADIRLCLGVTVLQSSIIPLVPEFDAQQIEDVEVNNYEW